MKEVRTAHSGFQRCPPLSFLCHFPLSSTRAMCRGYHMATRAPYGSISQRDCENIKMLLYTFMAAPSHSPICPPDGFCTSIRLSYPDLYHEALPSWPRCPHLSVTRDLQYFQNSVHLVFKLEQTIWIYVFYIYIFKLINKTHMVILSLKLQRAMPLPHKILSYTHINHFLQNWIFHEILFWWEEKLLLNILSNVFTKFWRSTCVHMSFTEIE